MRDKVEVDVYCVIGLKQKEPDRYVAIVDREDVYRVLQYEWRFHTSDNGTEYARAGKANEFLRKLGYKGLQGKAAFMHNFILPPPEDMEVDHLNGNGLDNRKCNLEIVTLSENRKRAKARADARREARKRYNEKRRLKRHADSHA